MQDTLVRETRRSKQRLHIVGQLHRSQATEGKNKTHYVHSVACFSLSQLCFLILVHKLLEVVDEDLWKGRHQSNILSSPFAYFEGIHTPSTQASRVEDLATQPLYDAAQHH
jgi:hypothetical protein